MYTTEFAISATNISKRYESAAALDDVTFSADYGEVVGLLGPNGAGKTSLIRILTTVISPSSGQFTVAGFAATQRSEIRSAVGVLPESAGYPKRKRAIDHLTYHSMLYGYGEQESEDRAVELLSEVGLGDRAGDRIGTFSRGMRQRLGIARALINEPKVLFLDEPTLGLDPSGQRDVLEMIGELARTRAVSVLLTSHLLDDIERLCDRVVILDRGRVVLDGPAERVLASRSLRDTFMSVTKP